VAKIFLFLFRSKRVADAIDHRKDVDISVQRSDASSDREDILARPSFYGSLLLP
jgi:hypothetical protein